MSPAELDRAIADEVEEYARLRETWDAFTTDQSTVAHWHDIFTSWQTIKMLLALRNH